MGKIIRITGQVDRAILHCAAVAGDWHLERREDGSCAERDAASCMKEVRAWHRARGWAQEGYHYLIMPSGALAKGRPLERDGAHTFGQNKGTLGVLLVERARVWRVGEFSDWFTPEQAVALKALLARHEITRVAGHNDYAARLCPGFRVRSGDWL